MLNAKIEKKIKGSRTLFFPTINGKRLNKTNFARKYDARSFLRNVINQYGEQKLTELSK